MSYTRKLLRVVAENGKLLTENHRNVRYHGNGEVIRREEFVQRKHAAEELQLARLNTKAKRLAGAGKKFDGMPVLQVQGGNCIAARYGL